MSIIMNFFIYLINNFQNRKILENLRKFLQNPCRGIVKLLTATEYVSLYLQVMQSYQGMSNISHF